MKLRGYSVEFLPSERRLQERRYLDSAAIFCARERRQNERREIAEKLKPEVDNPKLIIKSTHVLKLLKTGQALSH